MLCRWLTSSIAFWAAVFRILDEDRARRSLKRDERLRREFLTPENIAGIKRGVADLNAGRIRPWEDVKRELGLDTHVTGNGARN